MNLKVCLIFGMAFLVFGCTETSLVSIPPSIDLNELNDVNTTNPNNQSLVSWDASTGKWIDRDLNQLNDVNNANFLDGLDSLDFVRRTGNVNETVNGIKTYLNETRFSTDGTGTNYISINPAGGGENFMVFPAVPQDPVIQSRGITFGFENLSGATSGRDFLFSNYNDVSPNTDLDTNSGSPSARWQVGHFGTVKAIDENVSGTVDANRFQANVQNNVAPFITNSTGKNVNFNADLFDGNDSSFFVTRSLVETITGAKTFSTVVGSYTLTISSSTASGVQLTSTGAGADDFLVRNSSGTYNVRNTTDGRTDLSIDGTGLAIFAGQVQASLGASEPAFYFDAGGGKTGFGAEGGGQLSLYIEGTEYHTFANGGQSTFDSGLLVNAIGASGDTTQLEVSGNLGNQTNPLFFVHKGITRNDVNALFKVTDQNIKAYVPVELLQDLNVAGKTFKAMGEVNYFSMTGTNVSIASASDGNSNFVPALVATTLDVNSMHFDNNGSNNGTLRFIGKSVRDFHTAITLSISPAGANDLFVFGLCKNGVVLPNGKVLQKVLNAGDTQAMSYHVMISLSPNDYINVCVGNMTDADDLTIKTLNIFIME